MEETGDGRILAHLGSPELATQSLDCKECGKVVSIVGALEIETERKGIGIGGGDAESVAITADEEVDFGLVTDLDHRRGGGLGRERDARRIGGTAHGRGREILDVFRERVRGALRAVRIGDAAGKFPSPARGPSGAIVPVVGWPPPGNWEPQAVRPRWPCRAYAIAKLRGIRFFRQGAGTGRQAGVSGGLISHWGSEG